MSVITTTTAKPITPTATSSVIKTVNRKQYTPEFKLKVVLETLQRDTTIEAVKKKFNVHTTQINNWRKSFFQKSSKLAELIFESKSGLSSKPTPPGKSYDDLTKLIGELTVEIDILKKALGNLD